MAHLSADLFAFFDQLANNNHPEWFNEHKAEYEAVVKRPFEAVITDLLADLVRDEPELNTLKPRQCIYRIHRDVRFSKDKTPYKTNAGAHIAIGSKSDPDIPGFYIQIGLANSVAQNTDACFVAGGCYAPTSKALYNIRQEIVYQTETWDEIINEPEFKSLYGDIKGDALKTAPRDFKEDTERLPILRNKQYYSYAALSRKTVLSNELVPTLARYYRASRPLNKFLTRAIVEGI